MFLGGNFIGLLWVNKAGEAPVGTRTAADGASVVRFLIVVSGIWVLLLVSRARPLSL